MDNKYDYIKLKAFNLPTSNCDNYFINIITDIEKNYNEDSEIFGTDKTSYFCHIERELEDKFKAQFRVNFSDNDFSQWIYKACCDFANEFQNNNYSQSFYELYYRLHRSDVTIVTFIKSYILQKSYGYYIGDIYRHYDVIIEPIYEDKEIFEYLKNLISVEIIEYLPDEIGIIHMKDITKNKYLYKDFCWNHEDCFIDMKYKNKATLM